MAVKAAANPNIRPRRKREVQWSAIEYLWKSFRPSDGSRLKAFKRAYIATEYHARNLQIPGELFDAWSAKLLFMVDDRDDDADW